MAVAIIEDSEGQHVLRKPWTVVEHGVTPEEFEARVREDWRCDYIDGVLYMHSPASSRHEDLFGFLYSMMHGYVQERGLGKILGSRTLIHFASERRCEPDILYLPTQLAAKYAGVELFEVPPDVSFQDEAGRLWDILWMLRFALRAAKTDNRDTSNLQYQLHVRNTNDEGDPPLVTLKAVCGPGDDAEPVITIMLPHED